ncbi:MAG: hypothetical protein GY749_06645 [Desulfobacteraceae bacterium]|nr:hypothetical protein [Desulfobacteraceae bacterium]
MDKKKQKNQLKQHFMIAGALSVSVMVSGIILVVSVAGNNIIAAFLAGMLVIVPPLMMARGIHQMRRSFWVYDNTDPVWMIVSARLLHGSECPPHN